MEQSRVPLTHLFGSVAETMQARQTYLNSLDGSDGDAGDNAVYNWQVVAQAASEAEARNPDAGFVLAAAARALKQHGRGKTAAIYARGLTSAAPQFQGQQGLSLSDFQPLVESMTMGMEKGSKRALKGAPGSPINAFASASQGISMAREQGLDDQQAALAGLVKSAGSTGAGPGMGGLLGSLLLGMLASGLSNRDQQSSDPMGGLLGSLLGGMLGGGTSAGQRRPAQGGEPDLGSILGGLLGGGSGGQAMPPQGGEPDLGSILGGLLGGQGTSPRASRDDADDVLAGGILGSGGLPPVQSSGGSDDVLAGGILTDSGMQPTQPTRQPTEPDLGSILGGLLGGQGGAAASQGGELDLGSILGALMGGQGVAPQGSGQVLASGRSEQSPPADAGSAAGTILLEGLLRGLAGGQR